MLDSQAQQIAPPGVVSGESVTEEQTAEEQDDDNCSESQETEPVSPEPRPHLVDIDSLYRRRGLYCAVAREYNSRIAIVLAFGDGSCESVPHVELTRHRVAVD